MRNQQKRPTTISNIIFLLSVIYFFGLVPLNLFVYLVGGIEFADILSIW
jgi:hypothetical protein